MARRGLEQSEKESLDSQVSDENGKRDTSVPITIFDRSRRRNGSSHGAVPVMQGLPVNGPVDIVSLEAFVLQTKKDKVNGKIPHRGREGTVASPTTKGRPHRNRSRRGTYRS